MSRNVAESIRVTSLRRIALATVALVVLAACDSSAPVQPVANPKAPPSTIKLKPSFHFNGILFSGTHDAPSGEIYSMNPDGTGVTRLTFDDSTDIHPDVSPAGPSFISIRRAFGSINADIYSQGLDGKNRKKLTNLNISLSYPRYSPDGSKIAFMAKVPNASYEIFTMNANGSGITRLTFGASGATMPSWSPDGSQIAFIANDNMGSPSVWTMNANGSNLKLLVPCVSPGCQNTRWNPVTNEIAFHLVDFSGIRVVNATTGAQTAYIPGSVHDFMGTWSKDGSTIIFSSLRGNNGGLDLFATAPMRREATAPPPVVRLTQFIGNEGTSGYSK